MSAGARGAQLIADLFVHGECLVQVGEYDVAAPSGGVDGSKFDERTGQGNR